MVNLKELFPFPDAQDVRKELLLEQEILKDATAMGELNSIMLSYELYNYLLLLYQEMRYGSSNNSKPTGPR